MPSDPNQPIYEEALRGGQMWSRIIRRGQLLRITDVEGGASVAALLYNADAPLERYNMADTLKAQHTARLTRGHVLYSDMGRILCSIVQDSCGWHDTITGHMNAEQTARKFGPGSYQKLRNDYHRNTRDNFLIELGKHGLGKKDLVANVNFFVKVQVDHDGNMAWVPGNSPAGSSVTLRGELNTLLVLSATPHPLDPNSSYAPKPVKLSLLTGPPVASDDVCLTSCPENSRGFELTRIYFL